MTTHRQAQVRLCNETGAPIKAVSLVHKYSDNFVNHHVWPDLARGATSDGFSVDYNTGALTTGRDWWLVAWVSADGRTLSYSNPHNLRDLIDIFEGMAPAIATAIGAVVTSESGAWGGPVRAAITAPFVNNAKTSGFKQHILREEDHLTHIHLGTKELRFVSPSGTSTTGIAHVPVPRD